MRTEKKLDARSCAYFAASASALCANPTAPEATSGRVMSKALIAILKPSPSLPSRFSTGTKTLSKAAIAGGREVAAQG